MIEERRREDEAVGAVESAADNLDKVIAELLRSTTSERQGRVIDHDSSGSMEKKKQEGYF